MRAPHIILLVAGAAGCVGPPSRFSTRSAASLETDPARAVAVGIALREDPPLPGGDAAGWSGLAPAGAPMDHSHHGHMHHGGAAAAPAAEEGADHAHMDHGAAAPPGPGAPAPEATTDAPVPAAPAGSHGGGHDGH